MTTAGPAFLDHGTRLLRSAAELEGDGRTVLSLYLDLADGWEPAWAWARRRLDGIAAGLTVDEREALEVSVELIEERSGDLTAVDDTPPGLVAFVSLDDGKLVSLALPVAPRPLAAVDEEAVVWQLALQLDEYEPVGVIAVDGSEARVLVAAGRIVEEHDTTDPDVRHLTKAGGWSQMRYQRRRDEDIRRAADEVVDSAAEVFSEAGVERVLLAGREEMRLAVEERLPREWRERIVDRIDWDLDADLDDLLEEAADASRQAERAEEERLVGRLRAELRRGGLAVAGIDDTRRALEWGAVETLFVGPTSDGPIREELVAAAITTSAAVEAVPLEGTLLDRSEGVAALLRFPVEY